MLKVTVDIVPGGVEAFRRSIGVMTIRNISALDDVSDYRISVWEAANPLTGSPTRVHNFTVRGHRRRQSVWKLIAKVIADMDSITPAAP